MGKEAISWVTVVGAVCFAVGVMFRNLFDPTMGVPTNAFYYYQTFIAGIAAVIGALLTVHQMQKSEAFSSERHARLIEMQLWPVRSKVDRFRDAVMDELGQNRKRLTRLGLAPTPENFLTHDDIEPFQVWNEAVQSTLEDLRTGFPKEEWASIEELANAELNNALRYLWKSCSELEEANARYKCEFANVKQKRQQGIMGDRSDFLQAADEVNKATQKYVFAIDSFMTEIGTWMIRVLANIGNIQTTSTSK